MKAVVDLNLGTGKCYAGYLTDEKMHVFGARSFDELPPLFKKFLNDSIDPERVSFEKTESPTPKHQIKKKRAQKLNLDSLTGTYERVGGDRFTDATLCVRELAGGKISFAISALNGGHTGEEDGTADVVNGRAHYKRATGGTPEFAMLDFEFKFKKGMVTVTGDDSFFCGAGVTLLGDYKKTSDAAP